jgi:excisionase family DNA binding protein
MSHEDRLLTPAEVASLFRVDPKTVSRWASDGKISRMRTPGGHNRFRESQVRALLEENSTVEEIDNLMATVLKRSPTAR